MREDVKACVDARVNFFDTYYTVPESAKAEVDAFISRITAMGEASADAVSFESEFASSGLAQHFNDILLKCTPKPYKMTAEEKAASRETAKEIFNEDKGRIAKEFAKGAADDILESVSDELIHQRRERLIEEGTLDEYTRKTNAIENVTGFLGKLFGKK